MRRITSLIILNLFVTLQAGILAPESALALSATETFDTGLGQFDIVVGNTSNGNSFGFSNTSNAGGSAAEVGGTFARSTSLNLAYVADTSLGGTLGATTDLQMNGRFSVTGENNGDNEILVGFFDTNASDFDNSFTGLIILNPSISAQFNTGITNNGASGSLNSILTRNTQYAFSLGLNRSTGRLSGNIAGVNYSLTVTNTTTYDAFGIGSGGSLSSSSFNTINAYFDNLIYTTVPAPSSLIVIVLGFGCLVFCRMFRRPAGIRQDIVHRQKSSRT